MEREESVNANIKLNWFETHILMYLLFVKEFYDQYLPVVVTDSSFIIEDKTYSGDRR